MEGNGAVFSEFSGEMTRTQPTIANCENKIKTLSDVQDCKSYLFHMSSRRKVLDNGHKGAIRKMILENRQKDPTQKRE